ncbi:MAG: hypothetical protein QM723_05715 [Myxococcaceae bacterium]
MRAALLVAGLLIGACAASGPSDAGIQPCGVPCSGQTPICEPKRTLCVHCLADGTGCDEPTPHCDTTRDLCTQCLINSDCPAPDDVCVSGSCLGPGSVGGGGGSNNGDH